MNELFDEKNAGPAVLEVDRLVSEFYKTEMPNPWPAFQLPRPVEVRRPLRFAHSLRRLALAASVVVALVGYWCLTGLFSQSSTSALPGSGPEMGLRTPVKHLVPMERQTTPAGKDAQLFEEDTPGGIVINVIGPSTSKGPR